MSSNNIEEAIGGYSEYRRESSSLCWGYRRMVKVYYHFSYFSSHLG